MTELEREFLYDEHKRSKKQGSNNKIDITDLDFEQVRSFKYVGSVVNKGHKLQEEIKERIAAGNKVFYANKNIMFSK
jgi:hypothetical protein